MRQFIVKFPVAEASFERPLRVGEFRTVGDRFGRLPPDALPETRRSTVPLEAGSAPTGFDTERTIAKGRFTASNWIAHQKSLTYTFGRAGHCY